MSDQAQLAVLGPTGVRLLPIGSDDVTIGRAHDCTIVLESDLVSRVHCRLEQLPNGRHRIVDRKSSNGVIVNGRQTLQADLLPFDRVKLGEYELVYLDPRTDVRQVLEILSDEEHETTFRPPEGASLRERLLWLILTLQELQEEEDIDPLLDSLFDELLRGPPFSRAAVLLLDPSTPSKLTAAKLRNAPPDFVRSEALEPYEPLVSRALSEDTVVIEAAGLGGDPGWTACVPIRSHSRVKVERRRSTISVGGGLLLGASTEPVLKGQERRLLKALARQVGVLLSSARLQRQATVDDLTALANRAHIEWVLRDELDRARRARHCMGLLLLDIDDFKAINDTYGHHAGDEVLREVALRLRSGVRLTDTVGRWGGEEFLAILPGADPPGALAVAAKILGDLRATPVGPQDLAITASIGVACYPEQGSETAELVNRADQALYRAKREGKDRAVCYRPEMEDPVAGRTKKLSRSEVTGERPAARPVVWLVSDLLAPIPVPSGRHTIGRDPASAIVLASQEVSRRHGVLDVTPLGRIRYENTSAQGTLHNEVLLQEEAELAIDDRLGLGPYRFTVQRGPGDQLLRETKRTER